MKSASFATASLIALICCSHAAQVNFTAAAFSDVNQITTAGTLVEAVNLGTGATDVTVNTVVFAGGTGANLGIQAGKSDYHPDKFNSSAPNRVITGLLPADGDLLLDPSAFGVGEGSDLVTLSGLTIGVVYEIQLLIVEDRDNTSAVSNRTVTVSEVNGNADTGTGRLDFSYDTDTDGSAVQLVTGTFTADATIQTFAISQLNDGSPSSPKNAQINAYQLRVSPLSILAFSFDATAGESELTFTSRPGIAYQIWHSAALDPGSWTKIQDVTGADAPATETTTTIPEALYSGPVDKAFFRVAPAVYIITFSAESFLDEAQISTNGTLVEAVNFGTDSTDQDLNGITFTAAAASSANLTVQVGTASYNTSNYNAAIHTITGVTTAEGDALFDFFVYGKGTGSDLVTLSGLTVGVQYEFQVLFVDDRTTGTGNIPDRTMTVSLVGGTLADGTGPLDHTSSNVQLVTGTFTASALTQGFDISESVGDNVKINAYQLRAINP